MKDDKNIDIPDDFRSNDGAESYNKLQQVKRYFFSMRNGVLADVLRKGGSPFRIIFGLNLPQLTDFARGHGYDSELAAQLWKNNSTRESMLLAPMLADPAELTYEAAVAMISEVPAEEEADVLCLKLLGKSCHAAELASRFQDSDSRMERYTALRLWMNILASYPDEAQKAAEDELRRNRPLKALASRILQELDFLRNFASE